MAFVEPRLDLSICRGPFTNAPGLNRELNSVRIDELLGEQDRIEFELGSTSQDGPRRWSGLL